MLTEKMLQVSPTSRTAKNISELTNEVEAHNQMVMQPRLSEYETTESQMLALPIHKKSATDILSGEYVHRQPKPSIVLDKAQEL